MEDGALNIKNLLNIILKTIKKSPSILADRYLLKDVSIISKWRNKKVTPGNEDISKIVDFTVNESTEAQRRVIRDRIEILIYNSPLKEDIKETILKIEAFNEFLTEALSVSTSAYHSNVQLSKSIASPANGVGEKNEEDFRGKYTGVVKFDLVLSKNKEDKYANSVGKHGMEFKSDIGFYEKNRMFKLKKYIMRGKTILGMIIVAVISSVLVVMAGNNSQNLDSGTVLQATVQTGSNQAGSVVITPMPVQESLAIVSDKYKPAITPVPTQKPDTTADNLPPQNTQAVNNSSNTSTTKIYKKDNTNINNTDNSNTTNNAITISGDSNAVIQGNNNAISIEK